MAQLIAKLEEERPKRSEEDEEEEEREEEHEDEGEEEEEEESGRDDEDGESIGTSIRESLSETEIQLALKDGGEDTGIGIEEATQRPASVRKRRTKSSSVSSKACAD
jgi:hypothetical protein